MNYSYPTYNPYQNMPYNAPIRPFNNRNEIIKVNGENGAKSIDLGANESVIALDLNNPILWVVTADGAGYKTVSAFDIKPHEATPQIENSVADKLAELEKRISEMEGKLNEKSGFRFNQQKQTTEQSNK